MDLKNIIKAPKTTIAGILLIILIVLVVFEIINMEQFAEFIAAGVALGLLVASDPSSQEAPPSQKIRQ